MRHFEDLWNEAEGLVDSRSPAIRIEYIKSLLSKLDQEPSLLGEVLMEISGLSRDYNINVWGALSNAIDALKIDAYE